MSTGGRIRVSRVYELRGSPALEELRKSTKREVVTLVASPRPGHQPSSRSGEDSEKALSAGDSLQRA